MQIDLSALTERDLLLLTDTTYAAATVERTRRLMTAILYTPRYRGIGRSITSQWAVQDAREQLFAVLSLIELADLLDDDEVVNGICKLIGEGLSPLDAAGVACCHTPIPDPNLED